MVALWARSDLSQFDLQTHYSGVTHQQAVERASE
jgi:hypothetical protein